MKNKAFITAAATLLMAVMPAAAQRTAKGVPHIGISVMPLPSMPAASVEAGAYTLHGYWSVGLEGYLHDAELSIGGEPIQYGQARLTGAYMFRLACSRARTVNFYAGVRAMAAFEDPDVRNKIPSTVETSLEESSVVLGAGPSLSLELYPLPRTALVLQGCAPYSIGSQFRNFFPSANVGLRFSL